LIALESRFSSTESAKVGVDEAVGRTRFDVDLDSASGRQWAHQLDRFADQFRDVHSPYDFPLTPGRPTVAGIGRRPGGAVPSSVLMPVGSRPVSPKASRSSRVNAVPRLMVGEASTAEPRAWMVAVTPVGLVRSSYGACVITFPVCVVPVCVVVDAAQVVRGIAARRRWDPAERP